MLNNEHQELDCAFHEQLVPYMYGELAETDRGVFETHLADCMTCTDEFAGISAARFSVFEWHREAFVPLATPEIVIPYEPVTLAAPARAGWFAGLTELLAFARSPIAVAASLAIVLGIGALGLYLSPAAQQVSDVVVPGQLDPSIANFPTGSGNVVVPTEVKTKNDVEAPRAIKAVVTQKKPAAPRSLVAQHSNSPLPANLKTTKKPSLSTYADDDDEGLRLAALFDEIGGIRR